MSGASPKSRRSGERAGKVELALQVATRSRFVPSLRSLRRWAAAARAEIAALPDAPARAAFEALCDYVVRRTG